MIVRVSVGNNYFNYRIRHFMESLFIHGYMTHLNKLEDLVREETTQDRFIRLLSSEKPLDIVDTGFIVEYIKRKFNSYVKNLSFDIITTSQLLNDLQIDLLNSFTDRNENSEAFYWLAHSRQLINQ